MSDKKISRLRRARSTRARIRSLREHRPDLETLTDSALLARARSMIPYLQQTMENAMRVSSVGSLGPGALGAICE